MTPRKQSKRMWGVFNAANDKPYRAQADRGDADAACRFANTGYAVPLAYVHPLTVTWSPPNPKRKAKR